MANSLDQICYEISARYISTSMSGEEEVIKQDDTLGLIVGDSMRLAIILLLGHFASCMYKPDSELFSKDFINGLLFYVMGTIIFYIFFFRKCTLLPIVVFPIRILK